MRVVLHAGLHKSGTTTVQAAWRTAYAEPGVAWFPAAGGGHAPGHHGLVRPLLAAFRDATAPDLVAARTRFELDGHGGGALAKAVARAERAGVGTLVVSAEDLDRAEPADADGLREAFAGHDVTTVLTVTRPMHRWCSGWQTLVKHGLPLFPAEAADVMLDFAALRPGRLGELAAILPGSSTIVRLVRTSAPEPDLASSLSDALGLPPLPAVSDQRPRNVSLGRDTELVCRINRAGLGLGTDQATEDLVASWRVRGLTHRPVTDGEARYALPAAARESAAAEQAWLADPPAGVRVLDPHAVLPTWTDLTPPAWWEEIVREEADVPELDRALAAEPPELRLWRARQELVVLRRRVAQASTRLDP